MNAKTYCRRHMPKPLSRREMLATCVNGFGALACATMLRNEMLGNPPQHHLAIPARARHVIYLHMDGGVSHVDTFDPKPRLEKEHGQRMKMTVEPTQFNSVGSIMKSPWKFRRHGESGIEISDLFPNVATCADEICVIRSMVSEFSEHTAANYFMHTGSPLQGRPSAGAWISYGLGTENTNLPAFMVINGGQIPTGGIANCGSGFLPAVHQASVVNMAGEPIQNITPADETSSLQQNKLSFVAGADHRFLEQVEHYDAVESAIKNYELAFRMQSAVPDLLDLSDESAATKKLYGFDSRGRRTRIYARQCLLARRMVERGVRFIEVTQPTCPGEESRWDQHAKLMEGHSNNAAAVDQPIAALLKDLRSRGLLDETLVLWAGEFGRTPFAQGDGRDHNPFGFSIWMAGGGVRGGMVYGATDEYGYRAIQNRIHIHDLHATILHLIGVDHTKLTFRFSGRDFRLTDVSGSVAHDIIMQ